MPPPPAGRPRGGSGDKLHAMILKSLFAENAPFHCSE